MTKATDYTLIPDSVAVRLFNATIPESKPEDTAEILNGDIALYDRWNAAAAEHERLCSERIAAAEKAARVGALEEAAQVKIRLSNLASEPYSFELFDAGRQAKEDAIRALITAEAQPGTEEIK
jgi:hypothetical protein